MTPPDVILGLHPTQLVVIVFLLLVIAVLGWMYLAGDREGEMVDDYPSLDPSYLSNYLDLLVDEEPTLDVQNHRGD